MGRSKRQKRVKREVGPFVDKLVITFISIPLFPWVLWLSGQDSPVPPDEWASLAALSLMFWGIAVVTAWHAGGAVYLIETVCFALLFVPPSPWVLVLAGVPAPHGPFLARLLSATGASWCLAAILAWRFELWPFESAKARGDRHPVAVFHADPPERDYEPYFVAICECDWMGGFHADAESALVDARKHSPNTDENIKRPLDPDYVPPPAP